MAKAASEMKPAKVVNFLILIVFLDTLAVALVMIQIMPRLVKLGATPLVAGCIGSLYGAVQLFSSPFVGNLGDKHERKGILFWSILLSSGSYFLLGFPSLILFSISRILSGVLKHTHSLSMACISDLISEKEKGKYFGFFGGGIGAGFIFGPIIGGFLAQLPNGFQILSYATTAMFIINAVLVWLYLPDMPSKNTKKEKINNGKVVKSKATGITYYIENIGIEGCWDILLLQAIIEIGMMTNFNSLGLIMEEDYDFEPKDVGMFIGALSLVGVLTSAFSSKITSLFSQDKILSYMFGIIFLTFALLCLRPSFFMYTASIMFMSIATTIIRNDWARLATARSAPEKSGQVIGMVHSVNAVAAMLSPILGGIITQITGTCHSTTKLSTFIILFGLLACAKFPRPIQKLKHS